MAYYIAGLTKQPESKLEKAVSPDVLKEEENRERSKWRCPRCHLELFVGKDCSGCRKGLYDYDKNYDLLKQLIVAGDNDAKSE